LGATSDLKEYSRKNARQKDFPEKQFFEKIPSPQMNNFRVYFFGAFF
jgi:hypothetical protein